MSKMGLDERAQTANSPTERRTGKKGDVSKMGLEERAPTATHGLQVQRNNHENASSQDHGNLLTMPQNGINDNGMFARPSS